MAQMMEYKGYHATAEFSVEDKLFVGKVFGTRDSLNFHGTTVDELEQSFHDCIEDYLAMCEFLGCEPDKEYKGAFNVRVTPELHRESALAAESQGISLNQFVSNALELALHPQEDAECYVEQKSKVVIEFPFRHVMQGAYHKPQKLEGVIKNEANYG